MSIKIKYIYQNMGVEIIDSKVETWSRGTNSRLPFDVNVMLNLSIVLKKLCPIARDTVEIELLLKIMHCALSLPLLADFPNHLQDLSQ